MKKLILITIVCAFVTTPAMADPDPIHGNVMYGALGQMARLSGYFAGQGGEFTLFDPYSGGTLSNWQLDASRGYASSTRGQLSGSPESFQTFCLEKDEYCYYGEQFDVWVSFDNVDGTAPGSHAWGGGVNTNDGDDLDSRTAYLYTKFAQGTLSNYDYNTGRSTSAGELQEAIWFIEEEIGATDGQALTWVNEATTAVGSGGVWEDMGIGNVRVLQNANSKGFRQDFLYVVPIPPAVLLGILGLGAAGIRLRKFA